MLLLKGSHHHAGEFEIVMAFCGGTTYYNHDCEPCCCQLPWVDYRHHLYQQKLPAIFVLYYGEKISGLIGF